MHISTVFSGVYSATKSIYQAEVNYFKIEHALAERLSDCIGLKLTDKTNEKAIRQQLEPIRGSKNVEAIRLEKERNNSNRFSFLAKYSKEFNEATEHFPEALDSYQPEFSVNDETLQNSLRVAKIGKNLTEDSARALLVPLRVNKANFELVKSAMLQAGANPKYISDIYPYDGEGLRDAYNFLIEDVKSEATENVYSKLIKLEQTMIKDAKEFGVTLEPFIDTQTKENAINLSMRYVMGLSGDALTDALRTI